MFGRRWRWPRKKDPCGCGGGDSGPSRSDETERSADTEAVTRRSVIKGAGAAVAASGASGLLGAAAAMGQETLPPTTPPTTTTGPTLPYDIRRQVQGSELDPPSIQAVYDDINRMNLLMGDVPFRRLFLAPMRKLVPLLETRVPQAQTYGLVSDPERLEHLAKAMVKRGPDVSIADIYVNSRQEFSDKALKLFVALRRLGIRIPLPGDEKHQKQRLRVVKGLVKSAGDLTFHDYYTLPSDSLSTGARNALAFSRRFALLGWGNNDRCCTSSPQTAPFSYCTPATGKFCAIAETFGGPQYKNGVLVGICTDASTKC